MEKKGQHGPPMLHPIKTNKIRTDKSKVKTMLGFQTLFHWSEDEDL